MSWWLFLLECCVRRECWWRFDREWTCYLCLQGLWQEENLSLFTPRCTFAKSTACVRERKMQEEVQMDWPWANDAFIVRGGVTSITDQLSKTFPVASSVFSPFSPQDSGSWKWSFGHCWETWGLVQRAQVHMINFQVSSKMGFLSSCWCEVHNYWFWQLGSSCN